MNIEKLAESKYPLYSDDLNPTLEHMTINNLQEVRRQAFIAGYKAASEWVSVEDALPECLQTVWISNGKGWTSLGCRSDIFDDGEGNYAWCWAGTNGTIYEEKGKIVSECEDDDLDVQYWMPLPLPPLPSPQITSNDSEV